MDDTEALRILSALANGTHPSTGEIFPHDGPYQSVNVIRALFVAAKAIEGRASEGKSSAVPIQPGSNAACGSGSASETARATSKEFPRNPAYGNAGKTWSADEDRQLLAEFDGGKSLAEIGRIHGRTQNGVRARLEKHGRLEPSPATRWPVNASANSGRSTAAARPDSG